MKKTILSLVAILAFGFANAQGSDTVKFGVKAGINVSTLAGDVSEVKSTTGFYVGGLVDLPLAGNFHLQPELMYSMEGAKDASISYVRIPIMAKYYIMQGLSLQAGPEFAFKAGADSNIDSAIKSLDYGLGIGAGYELSFGLFFDARYNLGLADIAEDDSKVNTNSFQVGLGYRF